VIEATPIGGRRSDFFTAGKLAPGSLGLFQQHRSTTAIMGAPALGLLHLSQPTLAVRIGAAGSGQIADLNNPHPDG
jgi:hypothetical protein